MVFKCCVPNCKGNYNKENKATVFSFPTDENLRRKWIAAIPRDFEPTKHSKVCERHFTEDQILKTLEIYDSRAGIKVVEKLHRLRLKDNAVPCIFRNCPSYLSKPGCSRESRDQRLKRLENEQFRLAVSESVKSQKDYNENHLVSNFCEFIKCLSNCDLKDWCQYEKDGKVIFAKFVLNDIPAISVSVTVDQDLVLRVFRGKCELRNLSDKKYPCKLTNITELENVLETLSVENFESLVSINDNICNAVAILEKCLNNDNISNIKIKFICDQIKLLPLKCPRYNSDFLIICSLFYTISPHAYRYLRSTEIFTMPCPTTLHKICAKYECSPRNEQTQAGFLSYIKQKFKLLQVNDTIVTLMVDEIYIKPYFDYKGGDIVGKAFDSTQVAKTAHVFMIQSLKSSFKEVVHILPVNQCNAEMLFTTIKQVIIGLHKIGFNVVCVVSDNNAINRKAMSYFHSPPELRIVYTHPADSNKALFYTFDSVHILKCIRNNWLNQKDQILLYPDFNSLKDCVSVADFTELKKLYEKECNSLVKYGYGLNLKSLNPSQLERQNVKLVLHIFNELVIEGLKIVGEKYNFANYKSTANFMAIILNWWNIMNVKTLYKNVRLNNKLMEPLAPGQDNYKFLESCLVWLDVWKSNQPVNHKFSRETHLSFSHSIHALIQLAQYCIDELNFKYILPGKIQTDSLEARFGKYRTMAGSQYLITIRQVFEVESKLRLQSLLPLCLTSSTNGNVNITLNDILSSNNENVDDFDCMFNSICEFDFDISIEESDFVNVFDSLPIITYLSGYCARSVIKKISCNTCSEYLVLDKTITSNSSDINYTLIKNIDRGGLLYPQSDVVNLVMLNYIVFQKLINDKKYEEKFLKCENQRQLVINISSKIVLENYKLFSDYECNNSEHTVHKVVYHLLKVSCNILLNNYVKLKNNILHESKKKRKLNTLTQA